MALLVLGGGYGRGEGGVQTDGPSPRLFNDLDYFLFSSQPGNRGLVEWVKDWEKTESAAMGIDVECVILPAGFLDNPDNTMMFSDLAHGHIVVMGDADSLSHWRAQLPPERIPLSETTRLLWNRGSGLFFSSVQLAADSPDITFIQRNHAKLKLALGDAILCRHKGYTGLAMEREKRLGGVQDPLLTPRIRAWHTEGVAFKLSPRLENISMADLAERNLQLIEAWRDVFLGIESDRLAKSGSFKDLKEYARYPARLFPEAPVHRNLLLAVRDRLRRGGGLRPAWDYPRGALYRALADLLESILDGNKPPSTHKWILNAPVSAPPAGHVSAYMKWWHHYS